MCYSPDDLTHSVDESPEFSNSLLVKLRSAVPNSDADARAYARRCNQITGSEERIKSREADGFLGRSKAASHAGPEDRPDSEDR
jgi:hypothetical protein